MNVALDRLDRTNELLPLKGRSCRAYFARPPRPGQQAGDGASQGVNISRALDNLLEAQNEMIETWVDFETSRHALYRDTGTMKIDAKGRWVR